MRWMVVLGAVLAGCGTGSLELVLDLPDDPALAPSGATTITLVERRDGEARSTTTALAADGSFELEPIGVGAGVELSVELRSPSQRLVGYGRVASAVEISGSDPVELTVPMRRPFAYLTGAGADLVAFDSTRDGGDPQLQTSIPTAPGVITVPVAGEEVLVIGSAGNVSRIGTDDHRPRDGAAIALSPNPRDAVASPDGRYLVAGHDAGLDLVDLRTGEVILVPIAGGVDRVSIGPDGNGGMRALALSGRASSGCDGRSSLTTVALGIAGATPTTIASGLTLADAAASDVSAGVIAADACAGALLRIDGEDRVELGPLPSPQAVAVLGDRAFAVGVAAAVLDTVNDFTSEAAHLVLLAVDVDGGDSSRADLVPIIESMVSLNVAGEDVSRNLKARTAEVTGLAVVPPGELLALTYRATFYAPTLVDLFGNPVIPEMDAVSDEYLLLGSADGTFAQRVRTRCDLTVGEADLSDWECRPSPGQQVSASAFIPSTLAVLYGAR